MQSEQFLSQPKSSLLATVKIIITVSLLWFVASQIEYDGFQAVINEANNLYLGLALAFHTIAFLILSVRWWLLLKSQIIDCAYSDIFSGYYLGLFFNNLLPTGVGGDVVRILRLRKNGLDTKSLVSSTIVDRIIGLSSIVAMGTVAFLTLPEIQKYINPVLAIGVVFSLCIVMFYLFLSRKSPEIVNRLSIRYKDKKLLSMILDAIQVVLEYRKSRTTVLASFCLSLVAQHLVIISYIMIGFSLNISLSSAIYFSIVPIVFVTTSLPISIGGLGIRETTLVTLLTLFAVDKQAAITLSLLYFLTIVVITAPGGLVILLNSNKNNSSK